MSVNMKKYLPKFMRSTRWGSFCEVISTSINEIYDELLDTFFDHIKKETATSDDFKEIIEMLGYPLNLNYEYTYAFLKKIALTATERIRLKTTPEIYVRLFYALDIYGDVYPMIEKDNALFPLRNYDEITDIYDYLSSLPVADRFTLTKHLDVRVTPKYALEWDTSYYLTRPTHHYKLNDTIADYITVDYGTGLINGVHNLPVSHLGKSSYIIDSLCYLFDGVSDRIDTNYNSTYINKSICFWAKKSSTSQNKVIFGSMDDINHKFFLGFTDTGYMGAGVGLTDWSNQFNVVSIIPSWIPTDWHWYCLVFNNSLGKTTLYVDNIAIGYIIGSIEVSTFDYWIGCLNNNNSATNHFDGYLDDFRIYEYNISEEMRDDLWNSGNGRIDNVLKTGDLKQFFDSNSLSILLYEIKQSKMLQEVPHFNVTIELEGDETGTVKQYDIFDIDGAIIPDIKIETITTRSWLLIDSIQLDTLSSGSTDFYQLDETIPWTLDTTKTLWLNEIYEIKVGQALEVEINEFMVNLEQSIFEKLLVDTDKEETHTGGVNGSGQYIIDVNLGVMKNINWITEVGLFDTLGNMIYYAKFPKFNKIKDFNYVIRIEIDKP